MALDFDLEVSTNKSIEEIFNSILDLEGFDKAEFDFGFSAEGIVGGIVRRQNSEDYYSNAYQEMMKENFGFHSTVKVWFRPDRDNAYEIGMRNGLKAFMKILQFDESDAVIIMNGESVKLIRKNGQLVLNADSFHADEELIWSFREVPFVKYEVRKLQNIL